MKKIKEFIIQTPWLTADLITITRLFLLIPIIFFILKEKYALALIIFIPAILTDILDGYVARLKGRFHERGVIIDAGTDKIFILSLFLILGNKFLNNTLFTLVIFLELLQISIVIIGKIIKFPMKIKAAAPGKIKALFLGFGLAFLMFQPPRFVFLAAYFFWLAVLTATFNILFQVVISFKNLNRS